MDKSSFNELTAVTCSSLKTFKLCRRDYQLRYVMGLKPLEDAEALYLGTVMHGALEMWHGRNIAKHDSVGGCGNKCGCGTPCDVCKCGFANNLCGSHNSDEQVISSIYDYIDTAFANRETDERVKRDWQLLRAMITGYISRYPSEDFKVVAVEKQFQAPIINPDTGAASRSFFMRGKVDGIVVRGGEYFLLEHKTASVIDRAYIEKLPLDFQVTLYAHYIEQSMNLRIAGVIYNVIAKTLMKQGKGETEEEFETRRADLIAKSKTGKSTAKRKLPESDEEFAARLAEKYGEPDMFHRELLYIPRAQYETLTAEIWELCQQLLIARRTDRWYMNTDVCFLYHRPCRFFPICISGGNPNVIENRFRTGTPHPELDDSAPAPELLFA